MSDTDPNNLDALDHWCEWCTLQELIDYGINFIGDGWYQGEFYTNGKWAYIGLDCLDSYLLTVWSFDPRPFLAKIIGAEVHVAS